MLTSAAPTRRHRLDWLDYAAIALVAALVAATAALFAIPGTSGHFVAPGLDLVLDTVATVVTLTVAVLAWGRYREYREPLDHAASAAFLALAVVNGAAVAVAITGFPDPHESILHVGQDQAYVFAVGRIVAAAMLVFGGVASLRGRGPRYPGPMVVAPAMAVLLVITAIEMIGDRLPQLVTGPEGLGEGTIGDVSTTPFGAVVQLTGAALTMVAAAVWYRLWRRSRATSRAYLTLGLVIASFAQLHTVAYPGIHPIEVSSGDLLWLVFGAILVAAIEAEARDTLAQLRAANTALEELREVDVERAGLEERARVSRELHDGLAQDLWLAKLKAGRLAAIPGLDPEAVVLCNELSGAIDDGLAEAREAVMALRLGSDSSHAPLCQMLHRVVDEFADRFGVRTQVECDHSAPHLSHRTEAEVLRITQEALSNVRRHADATLVTVRFATIDHMVALTVGDNGKGFDPADLVDGGYGIAGMRERAALVRGRLTIDSRPLDGTRVTIEVPVDMAPAVARAGA